jgi:Ala-tRNA(Pro) deacylase
MAIPASIAEFLDRHHARYSPVSHPTAYTAQEEAAAAHVRGSEWAKSVVCMADDHPLLAVLPASCRVDLERLRRAAKADSLRLASEAEFKGLYPDCEVGAIPPLGPLFHQPVFVDDELTTDSEIVFNAGSHRDAIRMPYAEFERLVAPCVAEFGTTGVVFDRDTIAPRDAVCGLALDERQAWGKSEYKGETYYFCSQHCKMEFDDNPQTYARSQK